MTAPRLEVLPRDAMPPELDLEPLLTAADLARILGVRGKRVYELGSPVSTYRRDRSGGDAPMWPRG